MKYIIFGVAALIVAIISYINILPESGMIVLLYNIVAIVAGFYLLIKGADVFVEAASKIATKFNIPQMVIGLTIVAFGTSLPEAAVSIKGATSGNAGIAVGNVLGSNIANVLLILCITSCICTLNIKKNTFRIDMPFVIFISILLLFLGINGDSLSRVDGIILLILLAIFMVYLIKTAKNGESEENVTLDPKDTMLKMIILVIVGAACIVLGSNVTVSSASYVAGECGMTERLIGLTIVAFGTSLPELVTSVTAAKKGNADIAIGNIVGSNIFNILSVVAVASVVSKNPVEFEPAFIKDGIVAIYAAILLFICSIKNRKLSKAGGIIMFLSYMVYFGYLIVSNYA